MIAEMIDEVLARARKWQARAEEIRAVAESMSSEAARLARCHSSIAARIRNHGALGVDLLNKFPHIVLL